MDKENNYLVWELVRDAPQGWISNRKQEIRRSDPKWNRIHMQIILNMKICECDKRNIDESYGCGSKFVNDDDKIILICKYCFCGLPQYDGSDNCARCGKHYDPICQKDWHE